MLKTMNKKTTATIWSFEWRTGDLKPQKIKIEKFPKDILVVDGWFSPTIGELCLNSENKLDVVKDIEYIHPKDPFKGYNLYHLQSGKKCSEGMVVRVRVKKGKKFTFNNQEFVYQKAVDGHIIRVLALNFKLRNK